MNISKSRIASYQRCSMAFKYRYIDKQEEVDQGTTNAGTSFHNWSHDYIEKFRACTTYESIQKRIQHDYDTDEDLWNANWYKYNLNLLEKCVRVKGEDWREYFFPVYSEIMVTAGINDNTYRCICDRIYKTFTGELTLVEIKTGNHSMKDVRQELGISKIIIQASNPNINIDNFGIINPKTGEVDEEPVKKITMTYAQKAIDKFIANIEAEVFIKNDYHCGTCGYADKCYEFRTLL